MKRHFDFNLAAGLAMTLAAAPALAATITVNSTGDGAIDDGQCTLREAITAASANAASGVGSGECVAGDPLPTVDAIAFAIGGGGVHTIQPATVLPDITEAVTIDGYTQAGAMPNTLAIGDNAVIKIEMDGSLLGVFNYVLRVTGSGSTVRGLVFNRAADANIYIGPTTPTDDTVIEGNFFNTDPTGATLLGNSTAIRITGSRNLVGGTTPAARNILAGGDFGSIELMIGGDGNKVKGNYLGLDASGTVPLQGENGGSNGINLSAQGLSTNTLIGGDEPGAGNVIVAHATAIVLGGGVSGTTIQGNLIGTDPASTIVIAGAVGISTNNGPSDTLIGGVTAGAGNVFAGLNPAVYLGDGATGVAIKGNHFGVDASGTRPLPNYGNAIVLQVPGTNGSIIGGIEPGAANTIAYNCGQGVLLTFGPNHWPILGNSIHSNRGLGISLSGGTPTENDDGDGDTGANDLQNYPVITSAVVAGGTAMVSGTLNSTPSTVFRLEFFASTFCDASGHGEGQQFIGTADVTTDPHGDASFGPLAFPAPDDADITATATDPAGNTSEFSQCAGPHDQLFASGFDVASCGG